MKRSRKKKRIFLYLLLAVLCVAGMELLFCSYFAPATFARITRPVVQAAEDVRTSISTVWKGLVTRAQVKTLLQDCADWCAAPFPIEFPLPQVAEEAPVPPKKEKVIPADPVITQFASADGREILTGGVAPCVYYNQHEAPWSSMAFGGDPIGPYGCGPVAMSMVISSMTDTAIDPGQMAAWAADNGYWAPKSGSYHSLIEGASVAFGLGCTRLSSCTADQLMNTLLRGDMVVALMGPGHFTSSGHFIVLRGVTLSGQLLIADPSSRENSLATWDPQLILDQLYWNESNGLGLWQVSAPPPAL